MNLDISDQQLQQLEPLLSEEERSRANQFRFPQHRQRFIAGRGTLRCILGRYLKQLPEQLQFDYEPRGKPRLKPACPLQFNLSHSQDQMLCAVSGGDRVGIDLEQIRPVTDLVQLTQRFFLPQEHQTIHALPPEHQELAFFQYWTCKEAILKAVGVGLASLATVEVKVMNGIAELIALEDRVSGSFASSPQHWLLHAFTPLPDYAAALAVERVASVYGSSDPARLLFLQWETF